MKRLVSRKNLGCHVAPKEPGRYSPAAVLFTTIGSISTDGRKFVLVPYPDIETDLFPENPRPTLSDTLPIMVPYDVCRKALRGLKEVKSTLPALGHAMLESISCSGRLSWTDLATWESLDFNEPSDVAFPDWEKLQISIQKDDRTYGWSVEQLDGILKAAKQAGADYVNVAFRDWDWKEEDQSKKEYSEGIRFSLMNMGEELSAFGILMPMSAS
jgi:hypothetical protein